MENNVNSNTEYNEDDYLHVGALIRDYIRVFFRTWYVLFGLMALFSTLILGYSIKTFVPTYNASIVYKVEQTTSVTTNAIIAERVSQGISMVCRTRDFREDLVETMGDEYQSIPYSISAVATESADLFTVICSSTDPDYANSVLTNVQKILPNWIRKAFSCSISLYSGEQATSGVPVNGYSKLRRVIYGVIAGIFIWFILATFLVFSVRRIHGVEDLYQITDVPCLGVLPDVIKKRKEKAKKSLLLNSPHVDKGYLQAMNSLRSRIERTVIRDKKKVFLITSTKSEEGKTRLSLNLALSLKSHGKRVVIIDGDLRGNHKSGIFGNPSEKLGLSDFLTNKTNAINDFINKQNNFLVITAGKSCNEFWKAPDFKRFNILITALKKWADVILIDTPPTELFGDALVMSEMVDSVFYVIRGDYALVKEIRKGIEPFYKNHKLGGYVLNRITMGTGIYGYRYGYGYGGKYSRYRNYGEYGKYGNYAESDTLSQFDEEIDIELSAINPNYKENSEV